MRRAAIPEEQRVPFHLWIDEFQNFTTDVFGEIVSEARKYGLRLAFTPPDTVVNVRLVANLSE